MKVHPPFLLGFLPKVSSAPRRLPPPPPNTTPGRNGTSGTSYSSLKAPCNPGDPDRTQHLPDPPSLGRERKGGIDSFGDRRGLAPPPPPPPPGARRRSADELDKRGRSCGGAADADWASTASAPRLLPRLPAASRSRPRPPGETQVRAPAWSGRGGERGARWEEGGGRKPRRRPSPATSASGLGAREGAPSGSRRGVGRGAVRMGDGAVCPRGEEPEGPEFGADLVRQMGRGRSLWPEGRARGGFKGLGE